MNPLKKIRIVMAVINIFAIIVASIALYSSFHLPQSSEIWNQITVTKKFKEGRKADVSDRALSVIFLVMLFFIGVYGIVISQLNRKRYITAYRMMVGFAFVEQVVTYIFMLSFMFTSEDVVKEGLTVMLDMYNNQTYGWYKKYMDIIQIEFNCCGIESYLDWIHRFQRIPGTCCGKDKEVCVIKSIDEKEGCLYRTTDGFQSYLQLKIIGYCIIKGMLITMLVIAGHYANVLEKTKEEIAALTSTIPPEPDRNIEIPAFLQEETTTEQP